MLWIQIVLILLRGSSDGRANKTREDKKDAFKIIVEHVRNKGGNVPTLKKGNPRIVREANFPRERESRGVLYKVLYREAVPRGSFSIPFKIIK